MRCFLEPQLLLRSLVILWHIANAAVVPNDVPTIPKNLITKRIGISFLIYFLFLIKAQNKPVVHHLVTAGNSSGLWT